MMPEHPSRVCRFAVDESGQALPFISLMMVVLLGMCGIGVDVGRAYFIHRQLQAATDAAAMAGATALPASTAPSAAINYSAVSGNLNARTSLAGATMVSGYPKVVCLTTLTAEGMACSSPANGNAMVVKEQITINLVFLRVMGLKTVTIGASATASMRGASPTPYNVAVVVDTTLSMNQYDSDCGATQLSCALSGVRVLLQALSPCAASQATCTISNGVSANSVDRVALFTFPNVTVGTVGIDTNCTTAMPAATKQNGYYYNSSYGTYTMPGNTAWSGVPSALAYSYPSASATSYSPSGSSTATYQVTKFLSDYKLSDTATSLNPNSDLVQAAGGASGCGGMAVPNYAGQYGTYYTGAIYAAQASLVAAAAANPGSQNVLIILSDGDANAPQTLNNQPVMPSPATNSGSYPSYVSECLQGYYAASAATAAGTRVYTVAYGSPNTGCSTDNTSGVSQAPCVVMQYMASAPQYFYSDYKQSASGSTCYSSAQGVTSLSAIFTSIAADLTVARLIPDNTT